MPNITDDELAAIGGHVEATAGVVSRGDELDLPDAIIALCDRRRLLTEVRQLRGKLKTMPDLLAACREALRWIARNTPTVDSADPILGPIADEADRVREQIRDAIAKAEEKEVSRDG